MTHDIKYRFNDEDLEFVSRNMGDIQVRRLPVLNRDKRLVGIISLADIAKCRIEQAIHRLAEPDSRPGGQHAQSS